MDAVIAVVGARLRRSVRHPHHRAHSCTTIGVLASIALLLLCPQLEAGERAFKLLVTFNRRPLQGLRLHCMDLWGQGTGYATTDAEGAAAVLLDEKTVTEFSSRAALRFALSIDETDAFSADFVIGKVTARKNRGEVVVVRSAVWQMRAMPRECDELARIADIPVGGLALLSADDYNAWYARLRAATLANCRALARLQSQVGSLAPWYFYAYKGEWPHCVDEADGKGGEIDWAEWYRDLLAKATAADPGDCESDWTKWWASKGYEAVPDNPCWRKESAGCRP